MSKNGYILKCGRNETRKQPNQHKIIQFYHKNNYVTSLSEDWSGFDQKQLLIRLKPVFYGPGLTFSHFMPKQLEKPIAMMHLAFQHLHGIW